MLKRTKSLQTQDLSDPLEIEKAKISAFSTLVKRSSEFFTASSILLFVAAVFSFVILLTSFSSSTTIAIISCIFTVFFLAVGLNVNAFTKKESDFLCKVKRRPLGYLMRASVSKSMIITASISAGTSIIGAVAAFVMYASSPAWTLIALAVILILSLITTGCAVVVNELSRRYILGEAEFFDDFETKFAKRTHMI